MIVIACVLSIIGAITAFIISLAGAMKTVPQLHWQEAIVGVPLPVAAGVIAAWCLFRRRDQSSTRRPWISAGVPLAVATLALLLIAVSYFEQPGGPM